MQITEIRVTAARTFNNPYESYSNMRPSVALTATIGADEDADAAARALQGKAEQLVEQHKQLMLQMLEQNHDTQLLDGQIVDLERQLARANDSLADLRARRQNLLPASE